MELRWAQDMRDECASFEIPFFMKQMAGTNVVRAKHSIPEELKIRHYPDDPNAEWAEKTPKQKPLTLPKELQAPVAVEDLVHISAVVAPHRTDAELETWADEHRVLYAEGLLRPWQVRGLESIAGWNWDAAHINPAFVDLVLRAHHSGATA